MLKVFFTLLFMYFWVMVVSFALLLIKSLLHYLKNNRQLELTIIFIYKSKSLVNLSTT